MEWTNRKVEPQPLWLCFTSVIGMICVACGDEPTPLQAAPAASVAPPANAASASAQPAAGNASPQSRATEDGSSVSGPQAGSGPAGGPGAEPNMTGLRDAASTAGGVTYHKDIRPVIEGRCLGCHVDGRSGPFPLDGYEKVKGLGGVVVAAVTSRKMPPWLADDADCTPIKDDQRLSEEQLALFTEWQAADFPEGNEADYVPPPKPTSREIGEPNMIIKATRPFRLRGGIEDYFCLSTDARFEEDTWVTAIDLVPENDQYVHHAIVNLGSTCSALGTVAENIYSYRPGSRTMIFQEGDAMRIPAGGRIMIQFHYFTRYEARGADLPTDHSALRFWTLPPGEEPEREVTRIPHHDLSISIPVGAVDDREGGTIRIGREYTRPGAEIIGVSPHMHYLGERFIETLVRGRERTCLVNIDAWDQDWQLDYLFEPSAYIPISSGDRLTQDCYYNNRPEDQGRDPEGNLFTPRRTTFGQDTRQEMCLGYIWVRYPL